MSIEDNSVHINNNTASPIVTGKVEGNVDNRIENSFNTYSQEQKQNLAEAAEEIQALLTQLEQSYSTDTTTGKMTIATEAIEQIDSDSRMTKRIISALKAGGVSALEQMLNHPAASFFVGALEDWHQNKSREKI